MLSEKKKDIEPERWYVRGNETRIALMKYFVIITELDNKAKLDLIEDGINIELTLYFKTVDQAKMFTNDIINNTYDLQEIINEYDKYIAEYNWMREIKNIDKKSDEIYEYSNNIISFYKEIESELILACKNMNEILFDETKSQDEKDFYYKYYINLKESYIRLKDSCNTLYAGLHDCTSRINDQLTLLSEKNTINNDKKTLKKKC